MPNPESSQPWEDPENMPKIPESVNDLEQPENFQTPTASLRHCQEIFQKIRALKNEMFYSQTPPEADRQNEILQQYSDLKYDRATLKTESIRSLINENQDIEQELDIIKKRMSGWEKIHEIGQKNNDQQTINRAQAHWKLFRDYCHLIEYRFENDMDLDTEDSGLSLEDLPQPPGQT